MLHIPILPALHIAHPSNEQINSSSQRRVRGCTGKASLLGYQTSPLHLSLNGRVHWEVFIMQFIVVSVL